MKSHSEQVKFEHRISYSMTKDERLSSLYIADTKSALAKYKELVKNRAYYINMCCFPCGTGTEGGYYV